MALETITLNAGSGGVDVAADNVSSVFYPVGLVAWGVDGGPYTVADDASGAGLPVQPSAGAAFPVTDNSGSITIDAPVGTPAFVRLSDGSAAITTLPVSLASVPSHAVTNAGTFVVQVDGTALTRLTDIETNTDSGAVVGNGAAATAQRVSLANDSTGVIATVGAVTTITNPVAATQSGTWNVGTVTTVTAVTAVTAITNALPAGTNLLGRTASSDETSTVYNGTTALTPKFAAIAASSSGNNTLVAAVSAKKIRVLAYNLIGNGAVNAKFQSGASGTDLTGLKYIAAAGGGICAPYNPVGWFETGSNTLLNLNLSGAVAVGGELVYVEV